MIPSGFFSLHRGDPLQQNRWAVELGLLGLHIHRQLGRLALGQVFFGFDIINQIVDTDTVLPLDQCGPYPDGLAK